MTKTFLQFDDSSYRSFLLFVSDRSISSESKKIMSAANVPIIPGYHGESQDPGFLLQEAERIGTLLKHALKML